MVESVNWITDRYLDPDLDTAPYPDLLSEAFNKPTKNNFFKQLLLLFTYCTCTVISYIYTRSCIIKNSSLFMILKYKRAILFQQI
jgi:hypothetical protein